MQCRSFDLATLIGAPEWPDCPNEATCTLRYVPRHLRETCKAANTKLGYEDIFPLCDDCRHVIDEMLSCEGDLEAGWAEFDEIED